MSDFILADGSASISGEASLLAEKEYTTPLSKKDTTESLKTALGELLMYADTVKELSEELEYTKILVEETRALYQDELNIIVLELEKQQSSIDEVNSLNIILKNCSEEVAALITDNNRLKHMNDALRSKIHYAEKDNE